MTVQQEIRAAAPADASLPIEQVAQLAAALRLVEEIAGREAPAPLPDASAFRAAYDRAAGIARRRFAAQADDAAGFASATIRLLLEREHRPPAMAALLADELRRALADMRDTLGIAETR